jgi:hypothetical protein
MILRTELRRSTAPVAGIGFLVVSVGLLYSLSGPWGKRTAPWDEQWIGLAQWTRYLALFVSPLVIGVGAWQGLRDKRSKVGELFATTPVVPWRRALPTAGALALAVTAGYAGLLVVGGVQVAGNASYFHLKWVPVAGVMVLALVGIALLGMGIGRLVPSLVTPPVLAVAALVAQAAVLQTGWPLLLTPAFGAPDITVFTSVATSVTLTQALWFIGIGATGFGLFVASRITTRLAALLPMALSALVVVPTLSGVDSPVVADPDARALVCDDDGPRVCVTRAHADYLPTLVGPAREALALMGKLPSPPTSVVEMPSQGVDYRPPPHDVVPVFLDTWSPIDPAKIRMTVLSGADVPVCDEEDWDAVTRVIVARTVATAWLTGELTPLPGWQYLSEDESTKIQQVWQALQALPAAEQPARVAALRDAALDCRGDLTTLLETP